MNRRRLAMGMVVVGAAVLAITATRSGATSRPVFPPIVDGGFFGAAWDDGLAEINMYEATEVRYGKPRAATEAALIVVKEDHRSEDMVKADDPKRGDLPAIKLNWAVTVPTGIYTYRQMASVFMDRRTGEAFRETFSNQEWCGNTFKDLRRRDDGEEAKLDYRWSSYFGSEGDGERTEKVTLGARPIVFHDALPVWVRSLEFDGWGQGRRQFRLVPTLWANRALPGRFEVIEGEVVVEGREMVQVPAGEFEAWRVEVFIGETVEVYHVDVSRWHRLLRMERADGAVYALKKSMRRAYWGEHDPGDEKLKAGVGIE
ncbi:MAG: hypothetical protein CMJ49_03470 [Planctomycetaceae bacterium]|nr:hypothetical protein [Planctomycetaceae bacterium]